MRGGALGVRVWTGVGAGANAGQGMRGAAAAAATRGLWAGQRPGLSLKATARGAGGMTYGCQV